jgi:hypothetical protein
MSPETTAGLARTSRKRSPQSRADGDRRCAAAPSSGCGLNSTSYGTPIRCVASRSTSSASYSGSSATPRRGLRLVPRDCTCALSRSMTGTRSAVGFVQ